MKTVYFLLGIAFFLLNSCDFNREPSHRSIITDNDVMINNRRLRLFFPNVTAISGEAWRTSEGEFGYFTGIVGKNYSANISSSLSAAVGEVDHEKTDKSFLEAKWKAVFQQFSKKGFPLVLDPGEELEYFRWSKDADQGDVTILMDGDNFKIYATWYQKNR